LSRARLTVSDDGHVTDVCWLIHELTELVVALVCALPTLLAVPSAHAAMATTYLFYGKAVGHTLLANASGSTIKQEQCKPGAHGSCSNSHTTVLGTMKKGGWCTYLTMMAVWVGCFFVRKFSSLRFQSTPAVGGAVRSVDAQSGEQGE
jgi:hypothetical protein